tara:strand:+ start:266 stop:1012 length:747 start_codon:yes stop_codon:yes gene_type:complete
MINLNGMMSPNNHMDRTWGMIAVTVVSAGVGMYNANQEKQDAKGVADEARRERQKQEELLNKQKKEYKAMEFKNPFDNMENAFEDLTVNQQQAQFQSQQGNQQRANIMQNMKGAAGGSGIAGLAQAMANQGQIQTQRISASIGMQESENQMAMAKGGAAIQNAERQGDQWVQQSEMDRQSTLLGMQMGQTTGANMAYQQAQANQMNAQIAQNQATTDGLSNIAVAAGKNQDALGNVGEEGYDWQGNKK